MHGFQLVLCNFRNLIECMHWSSRFSDTFSFTSTFTCLDILQIHINFMTFLTAIHSIIMSFSKSLESSKSVTSHFEMKPNRPVQTPSIIHARHDIIFLQHTIGRNRSSYSPYPCQDVQYGQSPIDFDLP